MKNNKYEIEDMKVTPNRYSVYLNNGSTFINEVVYADSIILAIEKVDRMITELNKGSKKKYKVESIENMDVLKR